jgi:Na+/H+ antiporter NhaD/arsenite permease-like protein
MIFRLLREAYFPLFVLIFVYFFIAVRKFGHFRLKPWFVMMSGAILVLLTGQITPLQAISAINYDVIVFLFGMFIVGEAFSRSGYINALAFRFFRKAKTVNQLLAFIILSMGFLSPFFINDTMVIVATPMLIIFARKLNLAPKPFLLTMAFAVTTGSVFSPIGNPQNLLVALNGGMYNPFITFFLNLTLPTLVNLLLIYGFIKLFYRKQFSTIKIEEKTEEIKDVHLAKLSKVSFFLTFILIIAKVVTVAFGYGDLFRLTYIALIACLPIVIFSPRRWIVLKNIDWHTLIFFSSMFILMQSVWNIGLFQKLVGYFEVGSIPAILVLSAGVSQFISNVPFVSLYLPLLLHINAGAKSLTALAAGSTIAGNFLILGAASNIIIVQNSEKRGEIITFWDFARIGIPLTACQLFVYWVFLSH